MSSISSTYQHPYRLIADIPTSVMDDLNKIASEIGLDKDTLVVAALDTYFQSNLANLNYDQYLDAPTSKLNVIVNPSLLRKLRLVATTPSSLEAVITLALVAYINSYKQTGRF